MFKTRIELEDSGWQMCHAILYFGSSLFSLDWANVICPPPADDHLTVEGRMCLPQTPPRCADFSRCRGMAITPSTTLSTTLSTTPSTTPSLKKGKGWASGKTIAH